MNNNPNTYSYGGSLIHTSHKSFFRPTNNHVPSPVRKQQLLSDKALEKAAKKICTMAQTSFNQ